MLNLREGHYLALCWDDLSESRVVGIVVGADLEKYKVIKPEDLSLYFQSGKTRGYYLYDNAESIRLPEPKTNFKRATEKSILTDTVKDYYIKADELTFKDGLEAMDKGLLFMEVE